MKTFSKGQHVKIISTNIEARYQKQVVTIKGPAAGKDGREIVGWWLVDENKMMWFVSELEPVALEFTEEDL